MIDFANILVSELQAADQKAFDRPAVPAVYTEYDLFMTSGRYPYIDSVVREITERFGVAPELQKQLSREVYLASGQYRLRQMIRKETELAAQGFRPITTIEPKDGLRICVANKGSFRLKAAPYDDWALLAPRKRTHGLSLRTMIGSHRAYETAKSIGQTAMNAPAVVMFKEARS